MKNINYFLLLIFTAYSFCFANTAPTVTNITATQRTDGSGVVDIAYTLADADNNNCTISVLVSSDGGSTFTVVPSAGALSGALTNVSSGRRQIAWASKTDLPGVFGTNYRIKITADDGQTPAGMVAIPGGTFQMGNSIPVEGPPDELPVHTVTLSPFCMSRCEITNGQYCAYLNSVYPSQVTVTNGVVYKAGSGTNYPYCDTYQSSNYSQISWNGSTFTVRPKSGRDMSNDPMVCVSWYGSVAYCNWKSQQEGKPQCYNLLTWAYDLAIKGYHLPTEAQWEYAARGGLKDPYRRFPWGDTINQTQANFYSYSYSYDVSPVKNQFHPIWNDGVRPYTSPVGFFDGGLKYKANYNWPSSVTSYQTENGSNGYGLYDMAGNVLEWCHDRYGSYGSGSQTNPTGPTTGNNRVLRGGSWDGYAYYCRVACRYSNDPSNRPHVFGFRISLDF